MKKFTLLFSAIVVVSLFFYSCEQGQIDPPDAESIDFIEVISANKIPYTKDIRSCGEQECTLWAGQHIDAGHVTVRNDDANLYITVFAKDGFKDSSGNLKIFIETELPTIRPSPGQGNGPGSLDPYVHETIESGVPNKEVTYQIPYSDLGINMDEECAPNQFYVMAHADVIADGGGETAWGGCSEEQTGQGGWWYYIDYYTQCCECWCGFGFDYQNPEAEACLSMEYNGVDYKFWSDSFGFDEMKGKEYELSLMVNSSVCAPQDTEGVRQDPHAWEVGKVVIKAYEGSDDMPYMDVVYTLHERYKGYNIQLDLYNGADRIPSYNLESMMIITDEDHMLYQTKLAPGEVTYTFTGLPWISHDGSGETFIALHSAIGDCPMPSLQNPMAR